MNSKIQKDDFVFTSEPRTEDTAVLSAGLSAEAAKMRGLGPIEPFGFFKRTSQGSIQAGVTGFSYYGCLYIDQLWVDRSLRGQGIGTRLIYHAEILARQRGCTFVSVNTMDWEAQGFYQRLGYTLEFTRHGYAHGSCMHFLRKDVEV